MKNSCLENKVPKEEPTKNSIEESQVFKNLRRLFRYGDYCNHFTKSLPVEEIHLKKQY